ncbi:MAG: hypothetical protein ACFE9R_18895 [Candidatus Hermodarchaeota archaeon]
MIYKKLYFVFFTMTLTLCTLNLTTTASPSIPTDYNNQLDINEIYVYNVSSFNTSKALEWRELDWFAPPRGFVNVTPGGQILINFTGFSDKDPNDFFNLFESPIPYMNIEFKKIQQGSLITNMTFYNISNGEVDMNLLLGYNTFKSGFLIPINNFTYLKEQAYAQDQPPFMNATIIVEETQNNISFDFRQVVGFLQTTKSIYDKSSGLLIYTNTSVGNYTLEMTLTNLPNLGIPPNHVFIPSYVPTLILFTLSITSILLILKIRKFGK